MNRALAVVGETEENEHLVREAGELTAGVGAELLVLSVTPEAEYETTRESRERAGSKHPYSIDQAAEDARQQAESIARLALSELNVDYEAIGSVGRVPERILKTADKRECDHIFIVGRQRSPTGKALFGDIAQSIILNFAGPVTIMTAADAE